jgi:hypothetical protein
MWIYKRKDYMEMFSDDVVGIVAKMVEGWGGEGLGQQ